ncbi:AbiH family protein [Hallella mizrahii]|uniref:Bacteriophage abortive infection AbiH n=1 Tax=Hallella mizrahii TaxID=2606637 RepID=A0A7K0KIK4_9BACT|nr:AbiH family protein [Hallella mizrahii]MST85767.1 hypothetical protein [Hallella mizrahii]
MTGYRKNRLLILGNGFDVDLGMKSKYSDFAKSKVWQEKIENNALMLSRNGLLRALVDAKDKDAWFDIESTMMHYIRKQEEQHEANGYQLASTDREEYQVICSALKEYLSDESETFHMKNDSVAEIAFKDLMEVGLFHKIYTFNYTDINDLADRLGVHAQPEVCHVHGSLAQDDDIILGVEGEHIIPKDYKFMYKSSSKYYRSNNLYEDLNSANEIVFFGHSINGMDFVYFHHFFKVQSDDEATGYKRKYIRIFTYNNDSADDIKYSLRENGIQPNKLYALNNFDVILCKDLENGDKFEMKKYEEFKKDISRMSTSTIHTIANSL